MRLFVAVELDALALAAAKNAADALRQRLGDGFRARWISSANMHLTVRFIGYIADERVPPMLETLTAALPLAPFDLALGECGVFPPHGLPRVLWIGVTEGMPSLHAMHEAFNARVLPFGFEPEGRPYSAHLTLARVKDAPRGSNAALRDAARAVRPSPVRCRISHATVFESRLSPRGPSYFSLAHVPLRS